MVWFDLTMNYDWGERRLVVFYTFRIVFVLSGMKRRGRNFDSFYLLSLALFFVMGRPGASFTA
jgi:hypothetical protein